MEYLTEMDVKRWAEDLKERTYYCPHCRTELVETVEGNFFCPNEMCLYDEQGKIKKKRK